MATSILLARWLGVDGYGIFATAAAALAMLGILSGLGLPTLMTRLLVTYRERENWPLMRGLFTYSHRRVLFASLALFCLGCFVVWMAGNRLTSIQRATGLWALASIPLVALAELHAASLRGLHRTLLSQFPQHLLLPWLFLGSLALAALVIRDPTIPLAADTAFSLRFLCGLAAVVFGGASLLGSVPDAIRRAKSAFDLQMWRRSAWPLLFLGFAAIITTQTDVLMLGVMSGPGSAGVYQAAVRGAELVAYPLFVVAMVSQAVIARLYATGDFARLQQVVTQSARQVLVLSLPVALVLIVFSEPLLGAVFGQEFERASMCLIILCIAQLFNAAAGIVGLILNMTGHEREAAVGLAAGAVTNVLANAVLIPVWDIYGAAAATGVSIVLWNIVLMYLVRKRTGLRTTALG